MQYLFFFIKNKAPNDMNTNHNEYGISKSVVDLQAD